MEFKNVTAKALANVYFDGKVVSHGITLEDGSTKTFGLIYPGEYHFGTEAAERMEIIAGSCSVVQDATGETNKYATDDHFNVPANSGFTITVESDVCQYICSFLKD